MTPPRHRPAPISAPAPSLAGAALLAALLALNSPPAPAQTDRSVQPVSAPTPPPLTPAAPAHPTQPTPQPSASALSTLHAALVNDRPGPLVNLLLRGEVTPNTPDERGQRPLLKAAQHQSWAAVAALLAAPGIDIHARNAAGESTLMLAALHGQLDIVRQLIAAGAQVNHPGWTPLHYAASADPPEGQAVIAELLEHHAYIDAASPNGTTPLMMAARHASQASVQLLLQAGADTSLKNQQGMTAADFSRQIDRDYMVELLENSQNAANSTKTTESTKSGSSGQW